MNRARRRWQIRVPGYGPGFDLGCKKVLPRVERHPEGSMCRFRYDADLFEAATLKGLAKEDGAELGAMLEDTAAPLCWGMNRRAVMACLLRSSHQALIEARLSDEPALPGSFRTPFATCANLSAARLQSANGTAAALSR